MLRKKSAPYLNPQDAVSRYGAWGADKREYFRSIERWFSVCTWGLGNWMYVYSSNCSFQTRLSVATYFCAKIVPCPDSIGCVRWIIGMRIGLSLLSVLNHGVVSIGWWIANWFLQIWAWYHITYSIHCTWLQIYIRVFLAKRQEVDNCLVVWIFEIKNNL